MKLAIVLSNLSRFDIKNKKPLSGNAGNWFIYSLVGKSLFDKATLVICQENSLVILPTGTTHCILLGEEAGRRILKSEYKGLHSSRGTIFTRNNVDYILTYQPQDAFDVKAEYEEDNKLSTDEDATDSDSINEKDSTVTKRSNWRGWLTLDIAKFVSHIRLPQKDIEFDIKICPPIMDLIEELSKNETLAVDIETTLEDHEMTVIGFGFPLSKKVFVIPFYDYTGKRLYTNTELTYLYRAIYNRFQNSGTVIAHNSMFDFFILAYKYHIAPPVSIEDTMLMQHRIYPELEKSLGHCISHWTNFPYHKDEGIFEPNNQQQQETFWMYNAKDIVGTLNVWIRQGERLAINKGARDSCKQVNECIPAYLHNTLLGILLDTDSTNILVEKNTKALIQYQRVIDALVGPDVQYLPSSSQSCAKYFHKILGYPIKKRSLKTGEPSVDEGTLWKLKLANPLNVVIDFSIRYRELQKVNNIGQIELWTLPKEVFLSQHLAIDSSCTNVSEAEMFRHQEQPEHLSPKILTTSNGSPTDTTTPSNQLLESLPPSYQNKNLQNLLSKLNQKSSPLKTRNRVTTGWKIGGTTTLRLASAQLLEKWGTNLQNPNKQTLNLFTVEPGYKIVQVDQAGAEALIVAYLCIDGKFRNLFRVGIKSHTYLALHLFTERWKPFGLEDSWLTMKFEDLIKQEKWSEVTKAVAKDDLHYYMAKQTCHSANYLVGAGTFCLSLLKNSGGNVNIPQSEGKKFLNTYYNLFPEIPLWHQDVVELVKQTKVLYNLFGFPRQFFNINTEDGREMFAFVPQSTVGTITNIAFPKVSEAANNRDWYVLNNKHDSLAAMIPEDEVNEAAIVMSNAIEMDLIGRDGAKFKMKSETQVGSNWGKYRETKNPGGMRDYRIIR